MHIGSGRKQLVALELCSPAFKGNGVEIIDGNDCMRVSHAHCGQGKCVSIKGEFTHRKTRCISTESCGYRGGIKERSSHIHTDLTIVLKFRNDQTSGCFDRPSTTWTIPITVSEETRKTTNAIAAHLRFRAISVENAHAQLGITFRRESQDQSIRSDAKASIAKALDPAWIRGMNLSGQLTGTALHQNEVVAQTLIFAECQHSEQPCYTNTLQDFEN